MTKLNEICGKLKDADSKTKDKFASTIIEAMDFFMPHALNIIVYKAKKTLSDKEFTIFTNLLTKLYGEEV